MARGGRRGTGVRLLLPLGVLLLFVLATFLPSLLGGGRRPEPTGRVRSSGGGPAPAGTLVTARFGHGEVQVRTDARGAFRLEDPPAEEGVWLARWGPLGARVMAPPGAVQIVLPGVFSVVGRVVDGVNGEAVAGARVACGKATGATDARGRFRLEAVPVSGGRPPRLLVEAPGFRPFGLDPAPDDPWDDLFLRLDRR